jgi:hypothetical protein
MRTCRVAIIAGLVIIPAQALTLYIGAFAAIRIAANFSSAWALWVIFCAVLMIFQYACIRLMRPYEFILWLFRRDIAPTNSPSYISRASSSPPQ